MSCTSPIDIKSNTKPCTSGCEYKYTYGKSSCVLVNKGNYVEIDFSSIDNITFGGANYNLSEARIYKPSLHTWGGVHTSAELILNHKGSDTNLFICIPISKQNGKGYSNDWFNKFMRFIPTTKNSGSSVAGVTNFTLNNVIPQAPYYYYVGTTPWCSKSNTGGPSNHLIVFESNQAATMNTSDFANLERITNSAQTIYTPKGDLFFNTTGTKNGPSSGSGSGPSEVVDCYPVDIDGKPLTGDAAAYAGATPAQSAALSYAKIPAWFWTTLAIIGGIVALVLIYVIASKGFGWLPLPKSMKKAKQGASKSNT